MDRVEAVKIIKQIFKKCGYAEGRSVKLMPPDADSVLSKGCQIHIQDDPNEYALITCIARIAEENSLATRQENGFVIIYTPN